MEIEITKEFTQICRQIIDEGRNEDDWAKIESDDMFQSENFCGGFDATEMDFCFSYLDKNRNEYWFQFSLGEIEKVLDGNRQVLNLRLAE